MAKIKQYDKIKSQIQSVYIPVKESKPKSPHQINKAIELNSSL